MCSNFGHLHSSEPFGRRSDRYTTHCVGGQPWIRIGVKLLLQFLPRRARAMIKLHKGESQCIEKFLGSLPCAFGGTSSDEQRDCLTGMSVSEWLVAGPRLMHELHLVSI